MNATEYTIPEHYDTSGIINADSDPAAEFAIWQEGCKNDPQTWTGNEFDLADFEAYIDSLK
jgi:hypothetical protein